ncbi:cell division protein FtsQ/DivIB [Spirillospora sp. NPDC127200]
MTTARPSPGRVPSAAAGAAADPVGPGAGPPDAPRARRGRGRWKVAFVTLLVAVLVAAVGWVLLGSRLLVVRNVEVIGTSLAPRDRVVAAADVRMGLPMVRLGTGDMRDRVERLREVRSAKVERHWPATVRITVRERVPVAVVERAGRFYQLDRDGVTVADSAARPPRLPALVAAAPGPADPAALAGLRVAAELPGALKQRLVEVSAPGPETVSLRLTGGLTVVWGAQGRTGEKARLLEALRKTAGGRAARTIDVSSPEVVTTR